MIINKNIRLIEGDCTKVLKTLPDNSFDLIYTDPPYEINYSSNIPGDKKWNKTGETSSKFEVLLGDKEDDINFKEVWKELYRVLKDDSFFFLHFNIPSIIKYGKEIEECGFKYKGTVIWNKKSSIGGDIKSSMKKDWEPIFYYSKGKPSFYPVTVIRNKEKVTRKRISEIADWEFSLKKTDKTGHPTQKPVDLCNQILDLTTKKGDTILDPFAGSGTLGVSSNMLDRNCSLIELDETYIKLIKNRVF